MNESTTNSRPAKQVAAVPWRLNGDGELEVLLVTSRISRHWLVPKGWPISGKNDRQSALQEAFEEAGIQGSATKKPLGKFEYLKIGNDGTDTPCSVSVFGISNVELLDDWPERGQRDRQWYLVDAAAAVVFVPGLAAMLSLLAIKDGELTLGRIWKARPNKERERSEAKVR